MATPKKTTPSSRVKKLPKEGSKKFVGPYSPAQGRGEALAGSGEQAFGERPGQWHLQAPKQRGRNIGTSLSQRLGGNPMAGKGQNVQSYLGNRQPKGAAVNDLLAAIIKLPKEVRNSILAQLADAQRQAYIPF